jgi:hypothetical protein
MAEELYADRFGRLRHDEPTGVLELEWLPASGGQAMGLDPELT